MQIIDVPGVGEVEFPDDMDDGAISAAVQQMTRGPALGANHTQGDAAALSSHGSTPSASPKMGAGEALSRRAAQGILGGYGDELGGAVHALLGSGGTMKDRYLTGRDSERHKDDLAKRDSPTGLGFAAETAGAIANPLSRAQGFVGALGAGALYGHGNSRAEGGLEQAKDTVQGAGFGALGQQIGQRLGPAVASLGSSLRNAAGHIGFRHLRSKGGDIAAKNPLSVDDVEAAWEAGALRPFRSVHYSARKLLEARNRLGKQVGDLEDNMAAAGVEGGERRQLGDEFQQAYEDARLTTSAGDPHRSVMRREARDLHAEADQLNPAPAAAPPAPNSVPPTAPGGAANPVPPPAAPPPPSRMTLSQHLEKKRSAGWQAEKEFDRVRGQRSAKGDAQLDVWKKYKSSSDAEINRQGPTLAPEAHAQWAPANKQFSHIAKADQVAAEGSARSRGRNAILNLPNMMGGLGGVGAAVATGNPWALLAPVAVHELRTRGGSTAASALFNGSRLMSKAAPGLSSDLTKQSLLASLLAGVPDDSNQ